MSFRKLIALVVSLVLVFQQSGFAQTVPMFSGGLLPAAPSPSDVYRPMHLRYLSCEGEKLNLIFDRGSNPKVKGMEADAGKLVEYFLIGLSLPNDVFWVNLRPDSSDNIIDDRLARTDLGRVFLEADVQLKKDVAMATSPSTPQGRVYWEKLYKKAGELYGAGQVDIPTLIRPWIVPGEVIMSESAGGAYIYKATLKVMLEQDHLAVAGGELKGYTFADSRQKELNACAAQLMRELIIPVVTREVNSSRKYAPLRQAFYSLIFAQWFKQKVSMDSGPYGRRVDSGDLTGLTSTRPWDRMTYYAAYRASFLDGEYNTSRSEGAAIRSYTSGGLRMTGISPVVLPQSADPGQLVETSAYLEQAQCGPSGETVFTAWRDSARPQALLLGLSETQFFNAVTGADTPALMADGGKIKTFIRTAMIFLAAVIFGIGYHFFLPSPDPVVTPISPRYTLTATMPAPTPTATSTPRVLTVEKGAVPEAFSVLLGDQVYRFSPVMEGLEAELQYPGFPGGKLGFSYTSACIIAEGEYLDLRDMDSEYLALARRMLDRVNAVMTSGVSLDKAQQAAFSRLQQALTFAVKAASEAQEPDNYVGFRVDRPGTAYYVVIKTPGFVFIQSDGDATKRFILDTSTGAIMVGGRLYNPGDAGYAGIVGQMYDHGYNALMGRYRDDGWRIPDWHDQADLLRDLLNTLKRLRTQGSASPTVSVAPQASVTPALQGEKPTSTPSPTVTQVSGDAPPNATAGSFFTVTAGGADYRVWMEQGDMEVWVENKSLPGGKLTCAYDSGAILSQGRYIDLRDAEYAPLARQLLDSVNAMLNSGKLSQKQTEVLIKVQRHLKYYLDINAEAQKVSSMVGFRVDLPGSGYYILESTAKYAWLHNDEIGVKLIFNWSNGDILVGGKIYSPGDKTYPGERKAAAADMTGKAKQMLGGTFRTDGYRIDVPGQKALLNKLVSEIQRFELAAAQRDGGGVTEEYGGIDMSAIPLSFRADTGGFLARMGAFPVSFNDTARERGNIARLVSGGMMPSAERVQEFFAACYQKGELRRFSGDLLAWTALILRQQEEEAADTQPAMRQLLTVVQNI